MNKINLGIVAIIGGRISTNTYELRKYEKDLYIPSIKNIPFYQELNDKKRKKMFRK